MENECKIVIFKTLAISKFFFQSLTTNVPRYIVNELKKNKEGLFVEKFFSLGKA